MALLICGIEIVSLLHEIMNLTDPVTGWIANLSLDSVGYIIVGLFLVRFLGASAYWRIGQVVQRWTTRMTGAASVSD